MAAPAYGPFTDGSALLGSIGSTVDTAGNPITYTFKAPPVWSVSDSTVLQLGAPAANGLSIPITALKPGSVTVTAVGDGVTETATVNVIAGGLGGFTITVALAPPPAPPAA